MTMQFTKATRQASRLRIGLESPAGGGKTWTALKIATALAKHDDGRVALIDSERGSASKYSDGRPFDFDTVILSAPAPAQYIDALELAAVNKYPVVVVDSGSHEWKGVLHIVDAATQSFGGNSWSAWSKGRPAHEAFVDAILAMPSHVIVTFRSKQETEQVREGGRTVVRKLGMAPVTSEDMDYEFDVWGSIDHETHTVIISKSRIDTIAVGSEWPKGEGIAEAYLTWIAGAEYAEPPALRAPLKQAEQRPQQQQMEANPPPKNMWADGAHKFVAAACKTYGLLEADIFRLLEVANGDELIEKAQRTDGGWVTLATALKARAGTPA